MIIAVDAVGGDHYPEHPVEGAVRAVEEHQALDVILLGPEEMIRRELENHSYPPDRIRVHPSPEIIAMDEAPAKAVKSKQDSSIVKGMGLQKAGKCHGFVSTGNTGALLAASTFVLGKLEGVMRPTISTIYPTVKGSRLLLDAGANLEMRPEMYVQFAVMGCIYAEAVLGVEDPKVGLLNVGEEPEKGTDELKEAFRRLKDLPQFAGNVEGRDIFAAKADVFVCNGVTGNILLKFGESIPEAIRHFVRQGIRDADLEPGMAEKVGEILKSALSEFNYENIGGVPFLGVDGVSVVGHGGSSPLAVKNMILSAVRCVESNVNERIVASLN